MGAAGLGVSFLWMSEKYTSEALTRQLARRSLARQGVTGGDRGGPSIREAETAGDVALGGCPMWPIIASARDPLNPHPFPC